MRAVKRNLQKVLFQAASSTQPKVTTVRGDEIVVWNTVAFPSGPETWLLDTKPTSEHWSNDTQPMSTEPFAPRSDKAEIQYSRCDCLLAVEWCNCVR